MMNYNEMFFLQFTVTNIISTLFYSIFWHPLFTQMAALNLLLDEVRGKLKTDYTGFFHTDSLQIVQDLWSLVLFPFQFILSFSAGFRSEELNSHGRTLLLCPVTHFYVDIWCLFWVIVIMEDSYMAYYKTSSGFNFFYRMLQYI